MSRLSRRSVLRGSVGLAAAGSLASPFIANAAAKTATVWWTQGFVAEEDAAFKTIVAAYEKASGNTIEASITPFAPLMQKIVSALTIGDVPDVISHDIADAAVGPQNAWNDKLGDLTDIVDPLKSQFHPTAYLAAQYFNNVKKQRSVYYAPIKIGVLPFHIWGSMVEKAGFKMADAPKTWDAFFDFFNPIQNALPAKTIRAA